MGNLDLKVSIDHHDRLAQALGLYFATTFDLQRLFYKLQELKVLWTIVKVKQFSYFKTRDIKVVLYRFVDRFISVKNIRKKNLFCRIYVHCCWSTEVVNRDSSWGGGRLSLSTKVLLIFRFFSTKFPIFLFFVLTCRWIPWKHKRATNTKKRWTSQFSRICSCLLWPNFRCLSRLSENTTCEIIIKLGCQAL